VPKGRDNQLTKQIGEHLVVSKLGRLGYLATPFAGNVPFFDILAINDQWQIIPIQVKTIKGPSWQFSINNFLDIEIKDNEQIVNGKIKLDKANLIYVLVKLKDDENDEFYILQLKDLQEYFFNNYKSGIRPKNPTSMHCAVWSDELIKFKDNWNLLKFSDFKPDYTTIS